MMWLSSSMMILLLYPKTSTMLMELMILEEENKNIIMMTLMMGILTSFTKFKEVTWKEKKDQKLMSAIIMMALATFLTTSSMMFVIMMEMTMIPLVYLVLNYAKGKDKMHSMKYFIVMNSLGSIPFMIYSIKKISLINDSETEDFLYSYNESNMTAMTLLILLMVKTPMITMHLWLSNAHVSAPGTCSMILAGILIKMGTMGMMKFSSTYNQMMKIHEKWWMALSAMSVLMVSLTMMRYFDIKTMIALSSILHMSYMMTLMTISKMTSNISMMMMMTGHGIVSYYLFFMITMKYEMTENRSNMFNKSKESISKMTTLFMVTFIFMNMGVPPMINFMAEMLTCLSMMVKSKIMLMLTMTYMLIFVSLTMMFTSETSYGKKQIMEKSEATYHTMMKTIFLMTSTFMIMLVY